MSHESSGDLSGAGGPHILPALTPSIHHLEKAGSPLGIKQQAVGTWGHNPDTRPSRGKAAEFSRHHLDPHPRLLTPQPAQHPQGTHVVLQSQGDWGHPAAEEGRVLSDFPSAHSRHMEHAGWGRGPSRPVSHVRPARCSSLSTACTGGTEGKESARMRSPEAHDLPGVPAPSRWGTGHGARSLPSTGLWLAAPGGQASPEPTPPRHCCGFPGRPGRRARLNSAGHSCVLTSLPETL